MSPRQRKVSAGPWRAPESPNISKARCQVCGLRLHRILAQRGIREHILCTSLPPEEYDALLTQPLLRLVQGDVR